MRIAILGARSFPPRMSGIDNQVFELSRRLAGKGHQVFLFVAEKGDARYKNIHAVKIPQIRKEFGDISLSYLSYNLLSVPYILRYVRKHRIEIIHANNPISGFAGSVVKRLAGIPLVYTMRGTIPDNIKARGSKLARMLQVFEKRALANANLVTAITRHIINSTSNWYGKRIDARVIPNGIDLSRFRGANGNKIRREFNIPAKSRIILFVGRLVRVKGLKYLFSAMPGIVKAGPGTRLLIVGDGPVRQELEQQAGSLGISDSVIFAGHRTDIKDFLSASDLLALPSLHEGFPNVALEAMACGRPIVACRVTSLPEIIDRGIGVLAKPRSSGALGLAISGLLKNPEMIKSMGAKARLKSRQYSWDRLADVMIEEYKRLLEDRK
jgi:glycosyltransferase involved in cell wall biosynthesis